MDKGEDSYLKIGEDSHSQIAKKLSDAIIF